MHLTRRAAGLAALLVLAGCSALGGSGSGEADAAGAETSSVMSVAPGETAPPVTTTAPPTPLATGEAVESDDVGVAFLAPEATATAEASDGARLTVTGIRVGSHPTFDRVVFDVAGTGTPGWLVQHVATASEDASGEKVPILSDGIVQVVLTGMGYPSDTGYAEWAGDPISIEGFAQLWEVHFVGTFEGQTQAFLGTKDDDAAFRVFSLADPARVVVDVRH